METCYTLADMYEAVEISIAYASDSNGEAVPNKFSSCNKIIRDK